MIEWVRHHALVIVCAVMAIIVFCAYSWAEYGYYCDTGRDHDETDCPSFWATSHLHDWLYNLFSNWQSDLLIGILLVVVLNKVEGPRGADKDDT